MTEENIKLDRHGRKHCRACAKERKSSYHKGSSGVGRPNDGTANAHEREMTKALDANPPVVVWRKRRDGIYVKVSVFDPHPDGGRNSEKTHCQWGHEFTPDNTFIKADGGRQCRTCKSRWNSEAYAARKVDEYEDPLMTAARTEI